MASSDSPLFAIRYSPFASDRSSDVSRFYEGGNPPSSGVGGGHRPWFRIIADDLRQRLRRHEPKLVRCEWTSFEANAINWRDLKRRWNEPPITAWNDELLPRFEKLVAGYFTADLNGIVREYNDSDEVSAIAEAMNALRAHGITADAYSDMQTSGMIENNYPLK